MENDPRVVGMLASSDTDFKGTITNVFKDIKENLAIINM